LFGLSCLSRGHGSVGAINPLHSEEETARIVVREPAKNGYGFSTGQFVDLIRAGQPIFRSA